MKNINPTNVSNLVKENIEVIRLDFNESFENDWYKFRSIKIHNKVNGKYNIELVGHGAKKESRSAFMSLHVLEITLVSWFANSKIVKS